MKICSLALTLICGSCLVGSACAQSYTFAQIKDGLPLTTIRRPYAINDGGTILLQPYTAYNTSANCLLITGSTIKQTEQYPGTDQYYSLSNNGYITGTGIYGVFYLDDIQYNITQITVPQGDTAIPTGINSSLFVVGMATSPASGTYGWTWKKGTFTKYAYPGSTGCTLNGVNDAGDMVGTYFVDNSHSTYKAFEVVAGKGKTISVPSCFDPTPTAISTNDIVVGTALTNSTNYRIGFVCTKSGKVTTIDYRPYAPVSFNSPSGVAKLSSNYGTEVFGVNASGVIVGMFTGTYVSANKVWSQTVYIPFTATPK